MKTMRNSILIAIFILACAFGSFAQNPAKVDLEMKFRGVMPAIEVMVNGQGPFFFALDTGAQGGGRADSSLVEKLKLPVVRKMETGDPSGINNQVFDVVKIETLTVGSIQLKNLEVLSRNYNIYPNLPKIDGILGLEFFKDYLVTLDYPAKRVRFEKGELPKENGKDILSFENPRGVPVVELSVGNQKIKAHIDSGNIVGRFILPAAVTEKLTFMEPPIVVGKARTVANEVEIKQGKLKDSIRLGGFEFAEPTISFPSQREANIGSKLLSDFSITFDQKNKRLQLKKGEPAKEVAAVSNPAGVPAGFKDLVGVYGERTISFENGSLFLQRQGGMKLKLVAAAKDEFGLEMIPNARIKFVRGENGKVTELHILNRAGEWEKSKKEQP